MDPEARTLSQLDESQRTDIEDLFGDYRLRVSEWAEHLVKDVYFIDDVESKADIFLHILDRFEKESKWELHL